MLTLFKLFFYVVVLSVLMMFISLLSVVFRVRRHLGNPQQEQRRDDPRRQGQGDIIEGEYKVLEEKDKD
jgi:uncharacterized membrane protein